MMHFMKTVFIVFLFLLLFPFVHGDLGERRVLCIAEDSLEIQKVANYFLYDGVNKNHIKMLLAQKATNKNINKALKEIKEGMTSKDTLFFCYSGQVIISPSQDIYLLTSRKKQEAFPLRKEIFATKGNSVFILELENERNANLKQALTAMLKNINTSQQIAILAVDYYQNAEKKYNFWEFILQGLSYKANRFPHDSHVNIAEFFDYLKLAIPKVTSNNQIPHFIFSVNWAQNSNEINMGTVHYKVNNFFSKTAPFISTKGTSQIALKENEQKLRPISKKSQIKKSLNSLQTPKSSAKSSLQTPKSSAKSFLQISKSKSSSLANIKNSLQISKSKSISFSRSKNLSKSKSISFSRSKNSSRLKSVSLVKSMSRSKSVSFARSKSVSKSKSASKNFSKTEKKSKFSVGDYYALIIANYRYKSPTGVWHSLETPKKNAQTLKKILENSYGFKKITYLKNVSKRKIYRAFSDLHKNSTPGSNVLICYFGHGYYDVDSDKGYWVPTDAKGINTRDFISSSSIRKWLLQINAKVQSTFLICESAFTPGIVTSINSTKGKIEDKRKSCQILAFGDFEYIDEEHQNSQYSPFGYYLIHALKRNEKEYYSNVLLARYLRKYMKKAAIQKPIFGNLLFSQNEGGLFFFCLD